MNESIELYDLWSFQIIFDFFLSSCFILCQVVFKCPSLTKYVEHVVFKNERSLCRVLALLPHESLRCVTIGWTQYDLKFVVIFLNIKKSRFGPSRNYCYIELTFITFNASKYKTFVC